MIVQFIIIQVFDGLKVIYIYRKHTLSFESLSFSGLVICSTILPCGADSNSEPEWAVIAL
jgi:hypothetical protein